MLSNLFGSSHILTKFMAAQRRPALVVTQGVGCASCMCDRGIASAPFRIFKRR